MRASVAVAKAREFISGPHSLKAFCDKPLAPRTQSNQRGQKILTSFMKILFEKLASSSGLRASNMHPDFKYSSNSSDTSLEISLYSSGLISSCIKSALISSLYCLVATFFTNVFVWESLGILTVTFPDGFMNTIFTPSFGRSSTFIWLSISLSCTNKADEVFTAFSKVRDFFDRMRGSLNFESYGHMGCKHDLKISSYLALGKIQLDEQFRSKQLQSTPSVSKVWKHFLMKSGFA